MTLESEHKSRGAASEGESKGACFPAFGYGAFAGTGGTFDRRLFGCPEFGGTTFSFDFACGFPTRTIHRPFTSGSHSRKRRKREGGERPSGKQHQLLAHALPFIQA